MKGLLAGCQYIPSAEYFAHWKYHGTLILEGQEHYQKRTWRNKSVIIGPSQPLTLSIPLRKGKHQEKPIQEVAISYDEPWNKIHLHSIQTAYGKTAFFEEVEAAISPLYREEKEKLWEFNISLLEQVISLLRGNFSFEISKEYQKGPSTECIDIRKGIAAGKSSIEMENGLTYLQVHRPGKTFVPNLSILDVLCHLGPASGEYLARYAQQLYKQIS